MKNGTSCSGQVAVEHAGKDYWLSGAKETWNHTADVVCQQMHCGNATKVTLSPHVPTGEPGMEDDVWSESYNCSSTEKSVFNCPKDTTASSNHSVALVECSGNVLPSSNVDTVYFICTFYKICVTI